MSGLARISTELWIALAAFACFVIIGLVQYGGQQRALERYDTFSSYDYQPGGYRAWYDLLAHEGVRVQRFERRPAYLNDAVNTLIVANNTLDTIARSENGQPAGFFASGDYTALTRWVKSGGHLIWLTDSADSVVTTALQRVSSGGADPGGALHLPEIARSDLKNDEAIAVTASPLTAGVHAVSGSARQRIPFGNSAAVLPLIADDSGATVAWYPFGKGAIIVVTDESLFQNSRLAKADNARLSYDLVAAGLVPGGLVAFDEWSHGHQSGDTWWTILPGPMQWAFGIFCGAVILALAGSAIRFGPAVRLSHNTERTSEEYVQSMAQLMRRAGAARKALRDLAQLGHHQVAKSLGLPDSVPASLVAARLRGSERGERIADMLLSLDRLAGYEQPTQAELVLAADLCFRLRKEYQLHGDWRAAYRRSVERRSA